MHFPIGVNSNNYKKGMYKWLNLYNNSFSIIKLISKTGAKINYDS